MVKDVGSVSVMGHPRDELRERSRALKVVSDVQVLVQRWVVDVVLVRVLLQGAASLDREWVFVDSEAGGELRYGSPSFPLARVYFESAIPLLQPWRWVLGSLLVSLQDGDGGAAADVMAALDGARQALARLDRRRATRCARCNAPSISPCGRDILLLPGQDMRLAVPCALPFGHGVALPHVAVCLVCYEECRAAVGEEIWDGFVGRPVACGAVVP